MNDKAQQLLKCKADARHEPSYFIEDMRRDRLFDLDALTANVLRVVMSTAYEQYSDMKSVMDVLRTLVEHEIHRQAELHVNISTQGGNDEDC